MKHTTAIVTVEPLGGDLVALARCMALDATVFPHPSVPVVFQGMDESPRVWVARLAAHPGEGEGGSVVGHLSAVRDGRVLDVVGLAVSPEHRRSGIGRALLRAAMTSARVRRMLAVRLHVSTGNEAAIRLYEDEGFAPVKKKPGFYSAKAFPNAGDAWEMVLPLRPAL